MTGRRTKIIVIEDDPNNRDRNNQYLLTELPARKAERWAWKAFLVLGKAGIDIEAISGSGMAGIANLGIEAIRGLAKASYDDLSPLLDEMEQSIEFIPDPKSHPDRKRPLIESDVQEWSTWLTFRMEFIKIHTGFSRADVQ